MAGKQQWKAPASRMKNQREAGAFCDQILFSSEITTVFFIHYMDNGFTENLVTRENVSREKDRIRIGDRGTLKIDGVSPEKIQIIPWD